MTLDDAQRNKVAAWVTEGLKLSEIQNRLGTEFGLRLTYMDVRFLVDDLKLKLKDPEISKAPPSALTEPTPAKPAQGAPPAPAAEPAATGEVSVSVAQLARPGALVSGKVTFSDGQTAEWHLDQTGRLALAPQQAGYRPAAADVQKFQMALEKELSRMGM